MRYYYPLTMEKFAVNFQSIVKKAMFVYWHVGQRFACEWAKSNKNFKISNKVHLIKLETDKVD